MHNYLRDALTSSLLALCLIACSPQHQSNKSDNSLKNDDASSISDNQTTVTLSVDTLLNHPEFTLGMKQAVAANDKNAMLALQAKLVEIGREADFSPAQMQRLEGSNALDFMLFNAKRALFHDAVMQRYLDGQDIADIKAKFPHASDMFANADKLIGDRDKRIQEAARLLAEEDGMQDHQAYIELAKQQWQTFQQRQALSEVGESLEQEAR